MISSVASGSRSPLWTALAYSFDIMKDSPGVINSVIYFASARDVILAYISLVSD